MYSPVRSWRSLLNLSQSKLASRAEMSEQTVTRYEQLLYSDLSPRLITVFKDLGEDESYYETEYHKAQYHQRNEMLWSGGLVVPPVALSLESAHPFIIWRESLGFSSRLAFCRAACVSPPQLLSLEQGKQSSIPKAFRTALDPFVDLSLLDESCRKYHSLLQGNIDAVRTSTN